MSAYFVESSTVTAILAAGLGHTDANLVGNACSDPLRYREGDEWSGKLTAQNVTQIGRMLLAENVKSLQARYDLPADELLGYELEIAGYDYPAGGWLYKLTAGDVYGAVSNYEYQSCEHEGWMESAAHSLCVNLKERMLKQLCPGGSWGITQAELDSKRSGARSLMGMIGQ